MLTSTSSSPCIIYLSMRLMWVPTLFVKTSGPSLSRSYVILGGRMIAWMALSHMPIPSVLWTILYFSMYVFSKQSNYASYYFYTICGSGSLLLFSWQQRVPWQTNNLSSTSPRHSNRIFSRAPNGDYHTISIGLGSSSTGQISGCGIPAFIWLPGRGST